MSSGKHIFDSSSDLDWSVQNKLKLNTCGLLQFIARSEVLCSLWDSYNRKDEAQLHSESRQKEQNRNYKNVRYLEQYLAIRRLMGSTDQDDPSFFYYRISWILMERHCFYLFRPLHLVQGLRSLKHWLLQKLSMKIFDQKFKLLIKK